jgi:biotin transport system substrate-specific component
MKPARRLPARDLALIALFAGLIAALALPGPLYLPGNSVPITAQTLGVMLAGSILGARRGFLAVLVFLVLVAAGLPLLPGGRGGLSVFAGPTVGFLLGWPLGAWVTGWLTEKVLAKGARYSLPIGLVANIVGGIVVVYALGIPLQAWRTDISAIVSTTVAAAGFLPGDLIKAAIATLVAKGVHTGYPTLAREVAERDNPSEVDTST